MTNCIEEMMRTAGIEPKYEDCCKIADKYWNNEELANEYDTFDNYMNKNCTEGDSGACFSTCEYAYDKKIYPNFTPEKQLKIIKLIQQADDVDYIFFYLKMPEELFTVSAVLISEFASEEPIKHCVRHKDFTQALAQLTTELMKAEELDRDKVKEMLEE